MVTRASLVALFVFALIDWHSAIKANELSVGQQQLENLFQAYRAEENKFKEDMLKSHDADYVSQRFVFEAPLEKLAHFGPDFLEIANRHPKTDVAWLALQQVAYVRGFTGTDKLTAMRLLISDHSTRDEFYEQVYYHHYCPGIDAAQFSRLILEEDNVRPEIIGVAKFTLATALSGILTNEERIPEGNLREAKELLHSIRREHASFPHPNSRDKRTLGEAAIDLEFQITHLMTGCEAPEIVGEDIYGNPVRLSGYRGQVTLLVFCGEWCGPCRAMYPYEKKLVKEFGDQGFSILGINSDPKKKLEEAIEREEFPWKWIWDGGSVHGPIASQWGVDTWPHLILIDRNGVIRKKKFTGKDTEQKAKSIRIQVERLLLSK